MTIHCYTVDTFMINFSVPNVLTFCASISDYYNRR